MRNKSQIIDIFSFYIYDFNAFARLEKETIFLIGRGGVPGMQSLLQALILLSLDCTDIHYRNQGREANAHFVFYEAAELGKYIGIFKQLIPDNR